MTGWGQDGVLAGAAGHDINYIALAGALEPMGAADAPPPVPLNLVGDFGAGATMLAVGVLAALIERTRSGLGQVLDVAMVDGVATLLTSILQLDALGEWSAGRGGNWVAGAAPWYQAYETADGRHVTVGALEDRFYALLLERLGLDAAQWPQWEQACWPALRERLAEIFRAQPLAHWREQLEGSDACFAPVLSFSEAAAHPQLAARGTYVTRDGVLQPAPSPRFERTPGEIAGPSAVARRAHGRAARRARARRRRGPRAVQAGRRARAAARRTRESGHSESAVTLLASDDVAESWAHAEGAARTPLIVLAPLRSLLALRGIEAPGEPLITPIGDGLSNATFALRFEDGSELILRRPPRGPLPPSAHDVLREARIMHALRASAVPVPRIVTVCADHGVIGAPFYLMERVAGEVPVRGLPDALQVPAERRRVGEALADTLAQIHAVDLDATGLAALGARRSGGYLERQLSRHLELWEHHRTRELPAVSEIASWLAARMPASSEVTFVHGDYHPANVLLAPDAPARVVAVLDWELATAGDPLADLGYLCALWHEDRDPLAHPLERGGVTRGPGSLTRAELIERYAAASGRSVEGHGWYEVLAHWRAIIFTEGNFRRAALGATDTPFLRESGEYAPRLAKIALARIAELEAGG